jgi:hypothetical protein
VTKVGVPPLSQNNTQSEARLSGAGFLFFLPPANSYLPNPIGIALDHPSRRKYDDFKQHLI